MSAEAAPAWEDLVLVGRIARPHGLRGEVVISPETDFVEERFRLGATLRTRGAGGERQLTIRAVRLQGGRPVVAFEGVGRKEDAERLAGQELRIPEEALQPLGPGCFYHHDLVGCAVETMQGDRVGDVTRVEGGAGGSRLVVEGPNGEVLIPLAAEICVEIDVAARRIRVDPPDGLLDVNEVRHRHDLSPPDRRRARRGDRRPGH